MRSMSRPLSNCTGTILLKSPRSIPDFADSNNGSNESIVSGSHSMRGGVAAPKRWASSSKVSSSHVRGWRHG